MYVQLDFRDVDATNFPVYFRSLQKLHIETIDLEPGYRNRQELQLNFYNVQQIYLDNLQVSIYLYTELIVTYILWVSNKFTLYVLCISIRYRPRFFHQVEHQTMYASMGNKYFITKYWHRQTYQNYKQSRQKLGTFIENKVLQKSKLSKNFIYKSWSPSQIFFTEKKPVIFNWFMMLKNYFESTHKIFRLWGACS